MDDDAAEMDELHPAQPSRTTSSGNEHLDGSADDAPAPPANPEPQFASECDRAAVADLHARMAELRNMVRALRSMSVRSSTLKHAAARGARSRA